MITWWQTKHEIHQSEIVVDRRYDEGVPCPNDAYSTKVVVRWKTTIERKSTIPIPIPIAL